MYLYTHYCGVVFWINNKNVSKTNETELASKFTFLFIMEPVIHKMMIKWWSSITTKHTFAILKRQFIKYLSASHYLSIKKGIKTLCRHFLFQKVIFKARNKSNKNSVKDAPKNKKKKDSTSTTEKEISDQKLCDRAEKSAEETNTSVNERREEKQNNETDAEVQSEQNEDREEENETEEGTVGAGRAKQEPVGGTSKTDGNAKDEVDVKEEERGLKTEAEMGSCLDKASPTAQEPGRQDEEVDKQEDSSANQDWGCAQTHRANGSGPSECSKCYPAKNHFANQYFVLFSSL